MQKVIVNNVLSNYDQNKLCLNFLFEEWKKIKGNEDKTTGFPNPPKEEIKKVKHKFPAVAPLYEAELIEFRDFISVNDGQGETELIALVLKEDGFIEEVAAHRIQFVKKPESFMEKLVVEERKLSFKITKLKNFISSNPEQVQNILIEQLSAMKDYQKILIARLKQGVL